MHTCIYGNVSAFIRVIFPKYELECKNQCAKYVNCNKKIDGLNAICTASFIICFYFVKICINGQEIEILLFWVIV